MVKNVELSKLSKLITQKLIVNNLTTQFKIFR